MTELVWRFSLTQHGLDLFYFLKIFLISLKIQVKYFGSIACSLHMWRGGEASSPPQDPSPHFTFRTIVTTGFLSSLVLKTKGTSQSFTRLRISSQERRFHQVKYSLEEMCGISSKAVVASSYKAKF